MKLLLLLAALAMPLIALLSEQGQFGPDAGVLSARYPTLLLAAGYAFAIWSLIFALDLAFAVWQALRRGPLAPALRRARPLALAGFVLTTAWMLVFSQRLFWLALLIIWSALACLLGAAQLMARMTDPNGELWLGLLPLGLHAGWLSLAAILNTAQVVVAYQLLPTGDMLPWSLMLWAIAALLLLGANARLQGHPAYAFAVLWGLVGVVIEQSGSSLPGARTSAGVALSLAALLLGQTLYLQWRAHQREGGTAGAL
ncbi:hypothetical protein [Roseateles violae]|uniref:TspO/MBR related protein n=1 Tax=Roseateles violae TaxID=3058042 RepID=A0ABT8DZ48_9BURK|nr:hypothetical protein [Pelomonas sp. PFR6]MDN3922839.1 hypothetical protein [Pelomonas sp. PFR6]